MTNDDYTSFVKESMLNNYPYMKNLVLLFADHTADNEPKMTLRVVRRRLRNVLRLGRLFLAMMCSTGSAYSSVGNKDVSEMICYLKFIFVCIFVISQPTGNVFILD